MENPVAFKVKRIVAPDWFVDLWDRSNRALDQAGAELSVSADWIRQAQQSNVQEVFKRFPDRARRRYNTMMSYHHECRQMAWTLLRYLHLDKDESVAFAEHMNYEEATKTIRVTNGAFQEFVGKVQDAAKKIFRPNT